MTGSEITYTIIDVLTKFGYSDDSRYDIDSISFLRDITRAQLIKVEYFRTNSVRPEWLQDLGILNTTPVNFADNPQVIGCECDLSKITLPSTISLMAKGGADTGVNILSGCGTRTFYPYDFKLLRGIPKEHTRNKFDYYARIGAAYYLNKKADKIRVYGVLTSPKEVNYIINSEFVDSGDLVVGTSYTVYLAQVVHATLGYNPGQSFTASSSVYTGVGKVKLSSQQVAYSEDSPYPVGGDMARQIIMELLTKEFAIEESKITDVLNNSSDDEQERKKAVTP